MSSLRILLVDDNENNRRLMNQMLRRLGHEVVEARDGREAVDRFVADAPDLVLMDVMMPVMDGYAATAAIRALHTQRWVPVVFLTALNDDANLVRGLDAGGDDYLTKPVNVAVLRAKINAMQRIAQLQHELADHVAQLEHHRDQDLEERRLGSYVMQHLVHHPGLQDARIGFRLVPAHQFSGDLVAAARTPDGVLHLLLADAVGHGLAAALNVLPVAQVFYSMTEKGHAIGAVVAELNAKIRALMPVDRFVSAAVAAIDERGCALRVWNGGLPDVLVVNDAGAVVRRFESRHPPLGLTDATTADFDTEIFAWSGAGQLFLLTDGVVEAENDSGDAFGDVRLEAALKQAPPEQRLDHLLAAIDRHRAQRPLHDDASVLTVRLSCRCTPPAVQPGASVPAAVTDETGQWRVQLHLSAAELRYIDPQPILFSVMERFDDLKQHRNTVFLVLAELFNNALDHGLLALDSRIKNQPDGFERYAQLRQAKLQALTDGHISLQLERIGSGARALLKVTVTDSGPGFDQRALSAAVTPDGSTYSGRGLTLVRRLCASLRFNERGNEVVAYYAL